MEWNFRNDLPIYTQLMSKLKEAIVAGELKPGEKLPSVRDMALDAGVNPNTVQRALTDLEREGFVFSQRTSGRFVTEDVQMIERIKMEMAETKVVEFITSMNKLGIDKGEIIKLINECDVEEK